MNDNDIYSIDFTRSLPPVLKDDPKMIALARTIAEQLQVTARQIEKNIIYARIDELDEQTLDVLAYDLHVDWYDYSYPIEVKRQTIKDSVKVHRKLGTRRRNGAGGRVPRHKGSRMVRVRRQAVHVPGYYRRDDGGIDRRPASRGFEPHSVL